MKYIKAISGIYFGMICIFMRFIHMEENRQNGNVFIMTEWASVKTICVLTRVHTVLLIIISLSDNALHLCLSHMVIFMPHI